MNKFQQVEQQVVQPTPAQYSDRQFLHKVDAAVILPLWQSSITAFMSMVLTAIVLYLMDAIDYIKPVLVMGCLTWVFTWLFLQRRWLNLTMLETHLRMDINGDGAIGKKQDEAAKSIRVQVDNLESNGHIHQSQMFSLPCDETELEQIAQAYRNGVPFSEKEWTGKGKLFSVSRFREVRNEMLKRGMMAPASAKSERQGFIFTKAGQAILNHYAPSPTPQVDEA